MGENHYDCHDIFEGVRAERGAKGLGRSPEARKGEDALSKVCR